MPSADRIIELVLGNLGTLVLALLIIWALLKGLIVPGWAYRAIASERDRLFEIAVPLVQTVGNAAETLKRRNESDGLG